MLGGGSEQGLCWKDPTHFGCTTSLASSSDKSPVPEQPVFSFAQLQAEIAATAPRYALEDMATSMVQKIRRSYPLSAYALAGFCQSSLLAYECAQQLKRLGYEIPLLVMGDVFPPGYLQSLLFRDDPSGVGNAEAFYLSAIRHSPPSASEESTETADFGGLGRCGTAEMGELLSICATDPQAVKESTKLCS